MIDIRINKMTAVQGNGPVARFGFSMCHKGEPFFSVNGCALWTKKDGSAGFDVSGPRGEEYNGKRPYLVWFDSGVFKGKVEAAANIAYRELQPAQPTAPKQNPIDGDDDMPF